MKANLDKLGGLAFSQRVLLDLTQKNIAREDAYKMVQRNAMQVWDSNCEKDFLSLLKEDNEIKGIISAEELEHIFNYSHYTAHIDMIFNRVFE